MARYNFHRNQQHTPAADAYPMVYAQEGDHFESSGSGYESTGSYVPANGYRHPAHEQSPATSMSSQSREQQRRASVESNRHAVAAPAVAAPVIAAPAAAAPTAAVPAQLNRSSSRTPARHSRRRVSAHPPVSYSPRARNDIPEFRSKAEVGPLRESENKTQLLEQQLVLERLEHENDELKRLSADQQKIVEAQKQRNEGLETYLRQRQVRDAEEEEAKAKAPKGLKHWQSDCIIGVSVFFLVAVIAAILYLSITLIHQKRLIAGFTESGCRPL